MTRIVYAIAHSKKLDIFITIIIPADAPIIQAASVVRP